MTDQPARSVETMRQQLRMLIDFDTELITTILNCDTNHEISFLDLDDDDSTLLRRMGSDDRRQLFDVDERDANALLAMSDTIRLLGESAYSIHRHEFLLRRNLVLAKRVGGLAKALDTREAAEEIVLWINTELTDSPETNKDYRVAFRMFGELATEGEGKPASIEWVPGGYPSTYDPAPHPEEMFRWEEHILPMIDTCHNSRDRALIALAWDLGPRPSELFDLTVDRISDHKYGKKVTLYRGKQGTRSPVIVSSVPYVQQWLRDHPAPNRSDVPLWSKQKTPEAITNNRIRDIFKERARASTMTPPATPTPSRMRKSSASYLASQNTRQSHLEDHHGWRRGSKIAARYIGVFQEANDREVARAHGVEIDEADGSASIAPIECPRCQRETPPSEPVCVWCNQALAPGAAEEIQQKQADHRFELLEFAKDNPEFLDRIEQMTELVELVDANPSIVREARRYADGG